jgi:hypothetical protein
VPPDAPINTETLANKAYFLTHWDGGAPLSLEGKSHDACLARVKADQTFHMGPTRNWNDIGYNTLCCPHGRLIEGRGILAVGAQCPGYNRYGIGSQCMVGAGDTYPAVMLARQRRFYEELREVRGTAMAMMSHSDGISTTCAGPYLNKWVDLGMPAEWQKPDPAPIPVPVPIPQPARKIITVDGWLGKETITQSQLELGTKPDGVISTPYSALVAEIQTMLNTAGKRCRHGNTLEVDGAGIRTNSYGRWPASPGTTHTIEALQRFLGLPMDGYFSAPSAAVKAWQRWLNDRVKKT